MLSYEFNYIYFISLRYSCMDLLTILQLLTASTTILGPVTTSPDANTHFLVVLPNSSQTSKPFLSTLSSLQVEIIFFLGP